MGMPRRYHMYPAEFQVLNVMSSAGAAVLGIGYVLPVLYFLYSLKKGAVAGNNPWGASGLEWRTQSPPLTENFLEVPTDIPEAYEYTPQVIRETKLV
jgi:cytochrome c oxidase subunit 1